MWLINTALSLWLPSLIFRYLGKLCCIPYLSDRLNEQRSRWILLWRPVWVQSMCLRSEHVDLPLSGVGLVVTVSPGVSRVYCAWC